MVTLTTSRPQTEIIRAGSWMPEELAAKMRQWSPKTHLGQIVRENLRFLPPHAAAEVLDAISSSVVIESHLSAVKIWGCEYHGPRCPGSIKCRAPRRMEDYGIVSRKVVTTTGVGFIVDAFQNLTELENLKFHGIGTGTTAEASADTALVTELTTEYNPNSTRATGSLTEGASGNIFRTLGTNTLDSGTPAITEHGIFSQAATGGGTLLDRSVFSAINLVGANGDGLQTTYDLTVSAGG